jgi:HEAT repeat protein
MGNMVSARYLIEDVDWARAHADKPLFGRLLDSVVDSLIRGNDSKAAMSAWLLGRTEIATEDVPRVGRLLMTVVADDKRSHHVRNHAAESMGELLAYASHNALRAEAVELLIAQLADPEPSLRFWSAFALGQMRARNAISALRVLAADPSEEVHLGGKTVAQEAAESIEIILTHP